MVMEKSEVISLLEAGEVDIVFTKLNGMERQMKATRSTDIIPTESYGNPQEDEVDQPGEALPVWDCEVTGWRSFRWDRLQTVNGEAYNNG